MTNATNGASSTATVCKDAAERPTQKPGKTDPRIKAPLQTRTHRAPFDGTVWQDP